MGFNLGNLVSHGLAEIISAYGFAQDLTEVDDGSAAKRINNENVLVTVQFADPEQRYAIGEIRNEPKLLNLSFGLLGPKTLLVELEQRDVDSAQETDGPVISKTKLHSVPTHIRHLELKFVDPSGVVLKTDTIRIHS